jgi:pseudaminic acid cytidylyltransferase
MKETVVAIIPARGGSKRIIGKNIKFFAGKPIIAYSIEVAKESRLFDRVLVSTDSNQIARVARRYGAEVPFLRPAELSDDHVGTTDVVVHAINWLIKEARVSVGYACCIYATAPFLKSVFLKEGYKMLRQTKATTAFSVTTFSYPIFRALKVGERSRVKMFWPENLKKRSQDLPVAYHDAGQFYWINVKAFLKEKSLLSQNSVSVILPRHLVQDIDTSEDWMIAENMFKAGKKRERDFEIPIF